MLLFTIGFIILLNNPIRKQLTKPLRSVNLKAVEKQNIQSIDIQISSETKQIFDSIYTLYPKFAAPDTIKFRSLDYKNFINAIKLKNIWKEAKIEYNNHVYDVLIKIHGRSPVKQYYEGNYSFGVKVLNNEKINGCTRFNLIIYNRIKNKSEVLNKLANSFNLIHQKSKLFLININQDKPCLYMFERRFNNEFFNEIDKPLVSLKYKSDHSLLYISGDVEELNKNLKKAIKKKNLSNELSDNIYSKLNLAIVKKNLDYILNHFDIEYLSKIYAYIYLTNPTGHGFSYNNLTVAIDTNTLHLYPIIHRDMDFNPIKDKNYKLQSNFWKYYDNPLFQTLNKSITIKEKATNYLKDYLLKRSKDDIYQINIIKETHLQLFYSTLIKSKLYHNEVSVIKTNVDFLKKKLINEWQ